MNRTQLQKIGTLAKTFVNQFPSFQTCDGAYNKCKFASLELCRVLRLNGINAEIVHFQGKRVSYPDAHKEWVEKPDADWSHYGVRIDGAVVIDCTARQFEPECAVPIIEASIDTQLKWVTVEVDVFLNSWADELVKASKASVELS